MIVKRKHQPSSKFNGHNCNIKKWSHFSIEHIVVNIDYIKRIEDAHSTVYNPKVQFIQTEDNTEDNDTLILFKQVRYKLNK